MKIAYIAEWTAFTHSGVLTKLYSQFNTWRTLGHDAHLFIVSPPPATNTLINTPIAQNSNFVHIISRPLSRYFGKSRNYVNKLLSANKLNAHINYFSPELIYYRQGIWYPGLTRVLSSVPCVIELNTDDISEKKRLSSIEQHAYLYGRDKILDTCDGFLAVSYEIARLYTSYRKPIEVVGNGIIFNTNPSLHVARNNRRLQFIFAGTPNQDWHGVDKILKLAEKLNNCDFHVVGIDNSHTPINNVFFHGLLSQNELDALYPKMDIGLGTLALHRKNMGEASPLKVREYLAFGLPVIIGYQDTDLAGCSFVLNIGNYENNVLEHTEAIFIFAREWQGHRVARQNVEPLLNMLTKEKKRLKFFERIVHT